VAETWEIYPALPSGLNFSNTSGTISGIATELQVIPVNYTIWANNSGGVGSAVISITIVDQLPNITYPGDLELVNNTNSTDLPMLPIINGSGVILTWEIIPELPEGLNFSSANGSINGIAVELLTKTQYTVWANNSGGSSMAMFNITVVDQLPDSMGYSQHWMNLTINDNNSGFLPLTPYPVGPGQITSWQINATLPDGLNFSVNNGTIWGVPTSLVLDWQYFTVYGNNTGGSINSSIAIRVLEQIPTIAYNLSQVVVKNDTEMVSIEAIIGGGPFTTLSIYPQLPTGINFGTSNGTIWGTPTVITSMEEYTVWANNSGGFAFAKISISVEENAPKFTYPLDELPMYVGNEPLEFPMNPISTGGEIQNFSIEPTLPEGLAFGLLNGTIWGTPVEEMETLRYNITAYSPLGVHTVSIDLTIYDYKYNFVLDPVWISNGSFMPKVIPTYRIPGAIYDVSPDFPEGLSINPNTGTVSGRPSATMDLSLYTLYANVSVYTLSVQINLGVLTDTDMDGMPDEVPSGGNALGIKEDLDDDNDNVDDKTEMECNTDPYDSEDTPDLNSNGQCAAEPDSGYLYMLCLPIVLILLILLITLGMIAREKKKKRLSLENQPEATE